MAGLTEVPVIIRDLDEGQVMELALIENLQREDLKPLEEALGYQSLMETYGFTQEEVAKSVGKSRPAVTNSLRLLKLPEEIRDLVDSGELSAGHARALLGFPEEESMLEAARLTVKKGLSVRELEAMAQKAARPQAEERKAEKRRIPYFSEVELALNEHLSRTVTVQGNRKKGVLQIEFYGEEDLPELVKRFGE